MAVIRSLKRTPGLLRDQPVLFVPPLLIAILQTPQLFAQTFDPIVSSLVSIGMSGLFVFVLPFLFGGAIAIANDAATSGATSFGRFLEHGKAFYLSMLGAYLVFVGISIVFGVVSILIVFVGVFGIVLTNGGASGLIVVGLAYLLIALLFLAVVALFQFYGHAIVIEGARAFESLKRSVDVVRTNLKQVLGYFAILFVGGMVMGVAYVAIMLSTFPQPTPGEPAPALDLGPALVGTAATVVVGTLFGTVFLVYSVLFYRSVTGLDDSPRSSPTPGRR
ncbi:DUF7847 domain-containing protein [Natrarchaeobius oligotrophus]|uniref:DUF7847 domain-containing protein n=1 Tax=Natrarchaeobius chitinivorans TaxID=1679083 RepID=A0A3N6PU45_NATCH|nr:hypothetical protein [Natrarchaeobius chitinivorans]RQH03256.1 hypothetical protein EA472_01330 [Natrarchaeobius chitinivorans]